MAILTYTKTGTKSTTPAKLDKKVFGIIPKNHELIKAAYVGYLANGRGNNAQTKTRGLVSGGGRKPWKQKGTGRARFGSSRTPIWRGGGITFGPTGEENYTHKLHTNAKRQAIRQALSLSAEGGKIKIVESFVNLDGKTKDMAAFLKKIDATGTMLCVVESKDDSSEQASRNIPKLKVCSAMYLNVYEIMNADTIIMDQKALAIISQWLGGEK